MATSTSNISPPDLKDGESGIRSSSSSVDKIDQVLVVGAGLCGLATAIGLSKARIQVTILERSSELREIGAGIQIPPNAARVLSHLGLLEKIATHSVRPKDIVLRSYSDGSALRTLNVAPDAQVAYGFPLLVTHRADLCRLLYDEALKQGVTVRFGCSVQQVDFARPAVRLSTGETVTADLVLATDGAQSVCREALLGHVDPPKPSGKLIYRVCIDIDTVSRHPEVADLIYPPRIHIWLGPVAHVVCYGLKGVLNIVISQPEDDNDDKDVNFDVQKGDLDKLRQSFQTWEPRLQKLLELADGTLRWSLPSSRQIESWVHPLGRFALLGDAAHSTFPLIAQGAAMAFESALVLSSLLCSATKNAQVPALLRVYNSARFPRTSKVDELSRLSLDYLEMLDGPQQVERNRGLRDPELSEGAVFALVDPVIQSWLWGHDAGALAENLWSKYVVENETMREKM